METTRFRFKGSWASIVLTTLLFATAWGDPVVNDSPRPSVKVPVTTLNPLLTAAKDDPAWANAVTLPPMTPSLGTPKSSSPAPATKILLMWNSDYLYVRFICSGPDIYSPVHGHDAPLYLGDAVEVFLDPMGDSRQWIEMQFNADNDVFNKLFLCTAEPKSNAGLCLLGEIVDRDVWQFPTWDVPGLISHAERSPAPDGTEDWIVDVAIPAKGILQRAATKTFHPMTLKGDFLRYDWPPVPAGGKRNLFPLNWSPVGLGCPHISPAAYGDIILSK